MTLTPYQIDKFKHLETIKDNIWYSIKPERPDREEFVECLKLYIDVWNNIEFNEEFSAFRRAYPLGTIHWLQKNNKLALMDSISLLHEELRLELEKQFPSKKKWR